MELIDEYMRLLIADYFDSGAAQEDREASMPRIKTKWLVAWFADDGATLRDAVERSLTGAPMQWADRRCREGEKGLIWDISNPDDEKRIRAQLDNWSKEDFDSYGK